MGGLTGGKGGDSSGSKDGARDYPQYMKNFHAQMLADVHTMFNVAGGTPPTTYLYDPKIWLGMPSDEGLYTIIRAFGAVDVDALLANVMKSTYVNSFIFNEDDIANIKAKAEVLRNLLTSTPEAATDEMVDAYSAKLLQKVEAVVIPKIEIGMRDANAVIGSSFVIAKALAMDTYTLEVSEFTAKAKLRFWELRYDLYKALETLWIEGSLKLAELGMKRVAMFLDHKKIHEGMISEAANLSIIGSTKFGMIKTEGEIRTITWQLELQNHMNKAMASIAGAATVSTKGETGGGTMGMIQGGAGGALSGATAGAPFFPPYGAIVGGVVGGVMGVIGGAQKK